MIPYDPKDAVLVFPAGDYPAALASCEQKMSKAGNDMYELAFDVWQGERQMQVRDYVVMPQFLWKLKRLARAIGQSDAFEAGKFDPAEHIGRNLVVSLEIESRDGFDDRNLIRAYLPKDAPTMSYKEAVASAKAAQGNGNTNGRDLPF